MYISVQRQFQNWTKISSRTESKKVGQVLPCQETDLGLYHDSKKNTGSSSRSTTTNTSKTTTAAAASERTAPGIVAENESAVTVHENGVRATAVAAAMVDGTALEQQQQYYHCRFG
jgi:hypothetical protein